MANDLNQWHGIGHVTQAPNVSEYGTEGKKRASFSIACNSSYQGNDSVEYIPIVCFARLAELIEQYVDTGSHIYVSGKFQTRKWEKSEGNGYNYKTEIVAFQVQFLSRAARGDEDAGNRGSRQPAENSGRYYPPAETAGKGPQKAANDDDDLPF